jgi:CRP-like cAMP-binding protein
MVALKESRGKRHSPILAITAAELLEEMPRSKVLFFKGGEIVFREGSPAKDCYLIVRGKVRVLKKTRGAGEVSLAVVRAGEFLGEMAMISGERRSASAMAMSNVEAVLIHHEDFEDLLKAKHPFAARLSLQFSALLAARCQQLLGLIAQQKKTASPVGKKLKKPLDVRNVFNRVYTLWAV